MEGLGCALVLGAVVLEKGTGSDELVVVGGGSVLSMSQLVTIKERYMRLQQRLQLMKPISK